MTLLRRLGNKAKLADKIIPLFPPHKTYIEPFFGAGAIFFAKERSKYNYLNDLDADVFNLWKVADEKKDLLIEYIETMPNCERVLEYWNKADLPTEPIKKAARFLMLSNYTFLGKGEMLAFAATHSKEVLLKNLRKFMRFENCSFFNCDFREVFKKIGFGSDQIDITKSFAYLDPPYINTTDNYSHSFTESDSADLFKTAVESKIPFAMSEFDQPFILEQAAQYGLNVHILGERQNVKNRRTEILITNYASTQPTLF